MCKAPEAGKTRLAAGVGAEQALLLARAFLGDGAALAREVAMRCDARVVAFAEGAVALPGWEVRAQVAGDLGARMGAAVAAAEGPALLIGTDAPTLPVALAELAWSAVRGGADAAVVPVLDGGYCVLAMARPLPALLEGVPWSTPDVMAATVTRAEAVGLRLVVLPAWHDVDEAADLALLRLTLDGAAPAGCSVLPPFTAPLTRAAMEGH
jgi:rSAM/selenodomain-associated transferase 1